MLIGKEQGRELTEEEVNDWMEAFDRIDAGHPNNNDVVAVKSILMSSPQLWEKGHSLSGSALQYYIERIEKFKSAQLFIEAEARYIKEQLGYFTTNQIEKLIIDQILLCWIGVNHTEKQLAISMTEEGQIGRVFWQDTVIRYQNRYLRSLETLARIRKLNKGIAFQVNIATDGGQQVNVNEVIKKQD